MSLGWLIITGLAWAAFGPDAVNIVRSTESDAVARFGDTAGYPLCRDRHGRLFEVYQGVASIFELPVSASHLAILSDAEDSVVPITDRMVYVVGADTGRRPFVAYSLWEDPLLRCAFEVLPLALLMADAERLDALRCTDDAGKPLLLKAGEVRELNFKTLFVEIASSNPKVARVEPTSNAAATVSGLSQGVSSLTRLGDRGRLIGNCILEVNRGD